MTYYCNPCCRSTSSRQPKSGANAKHCAIKSNRLSTRSSTIPPLHYRRSKAKRTFGLLAQLSGPSSLAAKQYSVDTDNANPAPHLQNIMASNQQESSFNILGSSKLNTADGKNPTSSATTSTSNQIGTASGQKNNDAYRKECQSAHDALENKLRDEEREKKWTGNW